MQVERDRMVTPGLQDCKLPVASNGGKGPSVEIPKDKSQLLALNAM